MGARGSDAALEQAEVVLMHDRLENFVAAFELSCRARRVIRLRDGLIVEDRTRAEYAGANAGGQ